MVAHCLAVHDEYLVRVPRFLAVLIVPVPVHDDFLRKVLHCLRVHDDCLRTQVVHLPSLTLPSAVTTGCIGAMRGLHLPPLAPGTTPAREDDMPDTFSARST